jgi:hypothetical protein
MANSRIDKMVQSWNEEGRAWSKVANDDSEFFKRTGISMDTVGTSSDYGSDIMYYDTEKWQHGGKRKLAKGGSVGEGLEKELRKLQKELNSSRLGTYREGDNSQEALALKKEREVKLARFQEVMKLLKEKDGKYAKGGNVEVVRNEGNGKVINKLYNQWDAVKNQTQQSKWEADVRNTKFGTYGTVSFNDVLNNFDFDNANVSSFKIKTFKTELQNALRKMAKGGSTTGFNYTIGGL